MKLVLGLLLSVIASVGYAAAPNYIPGNYNIDPAHTRVSFIVPHFVVSEVEGRFDDVKGEFTLAEKFTNSKLSATVAIDSIDTGVKKRDEDLKSKAFFEASKYPTMKLVSKSVTGTPDSFKLVAALTIKDVTKDVTFDGKYTGSVKDSWGNQRAAFQMTGEVNRKDFHINYNDQVSIGPAVGEKVKIRIWTEGILADNSKKSSAKK